MHDDTETGRREQGKRRLARALENQIGISQAKKQRAMHNGTRACEARVEGARVAVWRESDVVRREDVGGGGRRVVQREWVCKYYV